MELFVNFLVNLIFLFFTSGIIWAVLEFLFEYETSFFKILGLVIILTVLTEYLTYKGFEVIKHEMKKEKIIEKSP